MATIQELKQRVEKAKREAARLETVIAKQKRSEDTKRKILMGAVAIDLCSRDESLKTIFLAHVDKYVNRESDRALLGLIPQKLD